MKGLGLMVMLWVLALLTVASACATKPLLTKSAPTLRPREEVHPPTSYMVNPIAGEPASIDEQVYRADVIVIASFVSGTAAVETKPGAPGVAPTYLPMQVLNFRAVEYLKGTGPREFTVEVWDDRYSVGIGIIGGPPHYEGYLTSKRAMTEAQELIAQRNTTWDNRPGVLFLKGPLTAVAPAATTSDNNPRSPGASSGQAYGFVQTNKGVQTPFQYGIDTLSRTWLPANEIPSKTGGETGSTTPSASSEYITDGAQTPPPVVTLSDLKTRIRDIKTMLAAGAGIAGYKECVRDNIMRERYYRHRTGPGIAANHTINSGSPAGSRLYPAAKLAANEPKYNIYSVSGDDAEYFDSVVKDEDTDASNGYYWEEVTVHPLPADEYTFNSHIQHYSHVICNHSPSHNNYSVINVTVAAPAGTLHEAFFNPTAAGTDDVSPVEFTVGGVTTEITGLEWSNDKVVLTLGTHVSLSGYVLDFIDQDGSVALSFFTNSATVDSTAGTYSWPMTSQPWENGDQLMLRIREDG